MKEIQQIVSAEPILSPLLLQLGKWIADYYCCALETALRTVLPQVIRKAEQGHKTQLFSHLVREVAGGGAGRAGEESAAAGRRDPLPRGEGRAGAQLRARGGMRRQPRGHHGAGEEGLIVSEPRVVERDPFEDETFVAGEQAGDECGADSPPLTACARAIEASHGETAPKPLLLHGVTGSGKTEIYLQAIQLVLERGESAIMLVPEISLTPQTVERFKSRFAATQHEVAVLHSHLSEGERHDEWHKIRAGRARIVIGARSAVFAPVENLGLIVVDEEHENTYKQEEAPRYHGRDLAVVRASMEKCAVLLGSATPSLESYSQRRPGQVRAAHHVPARR